MRVSVRAGGPGPQSGQRTSGIGRGMLATLGLLAALAPTATDLYVPAFPEMAANRVTEPSGIQMLLAGFSGGRYCHHQPVLCPLDRPLRRADDPGNRRESDGRGGTCVPAACDRGRRQRMAHCCPRCGGLMQRCRCAKSSSVRPGGSSACGTHGFNGAGVQFIAFAAVTHPQPCGRTCRCPSRHCSSILGHHHAIACIVARPTRMYRGCEAQVMTPEWVSLPEGGPDHVEQAAGHCSSRS